MDNSMRNHAPVFTDSGIYDSFPDPQIYANAQLPPLASGKSNAMLGKISVICLGSALLVCGVLSQAGAAVAFRFYAGLSEAGAGVWCGYMFIAAGAVAIVAAHHGTRNLIIVTVVTSSLAVVAALTQLIIAAIGLSSDRDYYYGPCGRYDWDDEVIEANGTLICAAALALIGSVWLLVVASIVVHRKQTSFQMHSVPSQHLQQQHHHQQMPLSHPNIYTNQPQMSSQFYQVPVQLILNALQRHFTEEIRNHQMLSIPIQFVNQDQHQQPISLNDSPPVTIYPTIYHDAPKIEYCVADKF